ncbi:MAG: flagellar motor protein MotB [Vicinamibacterales bacterium]
MRASGDRWLFGYADVVTLLFACFASLYAAQLAPRASAAAPEDPTMASASRPRTSAADAAATPAVPTTDAAPTPPAGDATTPPAPDAAPDAPTTPAAPRDPFLPPALVEAVTGALALPGTELAMTERGLVISLPEAGSFPPGQADLTAEARAAIGRLAASLRDMPNPIRVEGHTDDVPIRTAAFRSNWELSTARATRVVQFLMEAGQVSPDRLSAAGYAEYRPRVANDSPDHRARNRRVDIVVLDPGAAAFEAPVPGPAATAGAPGSGAIATPATPATPGAGRGGRLRHP